MKTFFRRLFRSSDRRPTTVQNRSRFRPFVEALEAREVPALFTWVGSGFGAGADFDTQTNWNYNGGGTATRLPAAGDDLAFISSMSGNANNVHGPTSGAYNSVSLNGAYSSTITLIGGFTTASLTLDAAGAAISQPSASGGYSNTDITVTSSFNWTNGTLNSSTHLSTLFLVGATATIAPRETRDLWNPMSPPIPGKVTTGDTISLGENGNGTGTTLTSNPGEVDFSNAGALNISENSEFLAATVTIDSTVKYVGVSQINVQAPAVAQQPAHFYVAGPGIFDGSGVPLYNQGSVWLHDSATAILGGSVKIGGNTFNNSYYQANDDSILDIQSGSNLTVEKTALLTQGLLKTSWNPNLADNVTAQTGTITGNLYVSGGLVYICAGGAPQHYGTFYVTGTVDMESGSYQPGISGATSGKNDHWESGGNFIIDQLPNNAGTAALWPYNTAGGNTVANGVWKLIKSRTGTVTGTFATTNLQYFAGPPAKSYTLSTFGNNEAGVVT